MPLTPPDPPALTPAPRGGKRRAPRSAPGGRRTRITIAVLAVLLGSGLVSVYCGHILDQRTAASNSGVPAAADSDAAYGSADVDESDMGLDDREAARTQASLRRAEKALLAAQRAEERRARTAARERRQRQERRLQAVRARAERQRGTLTPDPDPAVVTTTGPLGSVTAAVSATTVTQLDVDTPTVRLAVANIPNRTSTAGWVRSMRSLIADRPDFVTLNEIGSRPTAAVTQVAPGYGVRRAAARDTSRGAAGQSMNNAVLYRDDTWEEVAGGMVRVVDDDRGYIRNRPFVWDRFAVWSLLRDTEGAVVSVISVHMPTNPGKYPRQHGRPALSRTALYARGMDTLNAMVDQLERYGPVIVAGDMNSHPGQGSWTAASKMRGAGYSYVKDSGVMYLFHRAATSTVASSRQQRIASDHPALFVTVRPR